MKQVPYHGNPGNACALACVTMIAQYLIPKEHSTFDQLGKIADWRKGYVVWLFPVWKYLMDHDVCIVNYDVIDYQTWASQGYDALEKDLPTNEFNYYKENTYDLSHVSEQLHYAFEHPNFTYIKKKLTWDNVVAEFNKPGICDLTLNARVLNRQAGLAGHRVVLLDITGTDVVFHDPNADGSGRYRSEPLKHFRAAFESMEGPELARYYLK